MPPLETIFTVTLAGLALSATPGPSMLYVLSRSIGQSRAAGLASAVGLGLGGIVLAVATALGLAALFAAVDWLVPTLRLAGSAYLVWLGVDMIRSRGLSASPHQGSEASLEAPEARPVRQIVWQGMLIEVLNPKTVLFFALFLPPFVEVGADWSAPGAADVQLQLLILGILVPLTALPSDLLVAFLGGTAARAINRSQTIQRALAWTAGTLLITIAANIHIQII